MLNVGIWQEKEGRKEGGTDMSNRKAFLGGCVFMMIVVVAIYVSHLYFFRNTGKLTTKYYETNDTSAYEFGNYETNNIPERKE